jgi:hypothetical protein
LSYKHVTVCSLTAAPCKRLECRVPLDTEQNRLISIPNTALLSRRATPRSSCTSLRSLGKPATLAPQLLSCPKGHAFAKHLSRHTALLYPKGTPSKDTQAIRNSILTSLAPRAKPCTTLRPRLELLKPLTTKSCGNLIKQDRL